MSKPHPYPEIVLADGVITTANGSPLGSEADLQRMVDCWNALRHVNFVAHVAALEDRCERLEGLRKEAWARAQELETGAVGGGWHFDIENAPRGREVTTTRAGKDGPVEVTAFKRDVIFLASKCGKVIQSYWIPDEQRWCMLSVHEQPIAWMPWPEFPAEPSNVTHISARRGRAA